MAARTRPSPVTSRLAGYLARVHDRSVLPMLLRNVLVLTPVWPRRAPPAGRITRPPVPDFDPTPVATSATAIAPSLVLRGHRIEVGHAPDAASLSVAAQVRRVLGCLALLMTLGFMRGLSGDPLAGFSIPGEHLHDRAFPHIVTPVAWNGATVVDPAFAPAPVIGVLVSSDDAADLYLFDPSTHLHMHDGGFIPARGDYHWIGTALGAPLLGEEYGPDANAARLLRRAYADRCEQAGRPVPPLFTKPFWNAETRAFAWCLGGFAGLLVTGFLVASVLAWKERQRQRQVAHARELARRPWDEVREREALLHRRQDYAAQLDKELRRLLGDAYVDPTSFSPQGKR